MRTRTLQLSKKVKALMIVALLSVVTGMTKVANAQNGPAEWELQQPYLFYLVYSDVQAHETEMPGGGGYGIATAAIRYEQLPRTEAVFLGNYDYNYDDWNHNYYHATGVLGLAKNEKTGFQVFYREQEKTRNIKIEVSSFHNGNGDTIPHTVYFEEFFKTDAYQSDSLAEALVPYHDELKQTTVNHNKMFYVELNSTKEQPAGLYTSTVSLYEDSTLLASKTVSAKVWNFALPESHFPEVVMGLHNNNSGYVCTQNFLIYNGVNMSNGTPVSDEDRLLAKQILIGYQDFLLEHGVSTYEIPRWLIDDDPKEAELTMADPRRKTFAVPAYHMDGSVYNQEESNIIAQYKALVYDNPFIKDKAYFHVLDEPDVLNESTIATLNNKTNDLINKWGPDYHAVAPFNDNYEAALNLFEGKVDILCPQQTLFNPRVYNYNYSLIDIRLYDFMEKPHTWRYYPTVYLTNGDVVCYISPLLSVGTMRRVIFWQQYVINSDGILHWNCASYGDNPWTNKTLPIGGEVSWTGQGNNGDGILLYPGLPVNEEATIPIASLRLKQIVAGLNDYDYLKLTEEFISEEAAASYYHEIFWTMNAHLSYIMSKETGFDGWTSHSMNTMKYRMGEGLSAANTEHNWDEWKTAVLPDETHAGLEIRTCQNCGTQESRPKTFLYRFLGTEDNQWSNLANWEGSPQSLPTLGEAVFIAHDCEIDDDQTVSSVTVKNGFNLTVKSGATLTSRLMVTEENAQVIIEDGAQLYTVSEGVQATVKKNIAPHGDGDGWYFISTSLASDVAPGTSNGMVPSEGSYDLYYFDQSEDQQWQNYKAVSFNLENGKGYLYANSEEEVSLAFTGTTNGDAAKEVSLAYDADSYLAGWNLVGNPYPCKVYSNKSYYTLNEDGNSIEPQIVSTSTAIEPCTGIMVKTPESGESVTFSKTAPAAISNNGNLQIIVTQDNTIMDKAVVSFNEGDGLEKFVLREGGVRLSIFQKGGDYAVACAEKQGEMPLNFKVAEKGTYALTVSSEQVEMEYLHLIDRSTGTNVDLLQTPVYTFHATGQEPEARFIITFKVKAE